MCEDMQHIFMGPAILFKSLWVPSFCVVPIALHPPLHLSPAHREGPIRARDPLVRKFQESWWPSGHSHTRWQCCLYRIVDCWHSCKRGLIWLWISIPNDRSKLREWIFKPLFSFACQIDLPHWVILSFSKGCPSIVWIRVYKLYMCPQFWCRFC